MVGMLHLLCLKKSLYFEVKVEMIIKKLTTTHAFLLDPTKLEQQESLLMERSILTEVCTAWWF